MTLEPCTCTSPSPHLKCQGIAQSLSVLPALPLQVNMRGRLSADTRKRHPTAPEVVQWHAGVLLPKGVALGKGTLSPRYFW